MDQAGIRIIAIFPNDYESGNFRYGGSDFEGGFADGRDVSCSTPLRDASCSVVQFTSCLSEDPLVTGA